MNRILLGLIVAMTFSCIQEDDAIPQFPLDPSDQFLAEEYEVYNVILERLDIPQLVIRQQTTRFTPPEGDLSLFFNLDKMAAMDANLYSRYTEANDRRFLLDEQFSVPDKKVHLLSNKAHTHYFDRQDEGKGWEIFHEKYPNAQRWFVVVNKIGFNESRTQAMVGSEAYWFMENPDGATLKFGRLFYLEKKNGVWQHVGDTGYTL